MHMQARQSAADTSVAAHLPIHAQSYLLDGGDPTTVQHNSVRNNAVHSATFTGAVTDTPFKLLPSDEKPGHDRQPERTDWTRVITDYSSRHLSDGSDKLPAFAAIAEAAAKHLDFKPGQYFAGLRDQLSLIAQLQWKPETPHRNRELPAAAPNLNRLKPT